MRDIFKAKECESGGEKKLPRARSAEFKPIVVVGTSIAEGELKNIPVGRLRSTLGGYSETWLQETKRPKKAVAEERSGSP
jgi:hypothetical protein